jgi:hypothetical protein
MFLILNGGKMENGIKLTLFFATETQKHGKPNQVGNPERSILN